MKRAFIELKQTDLTGFHPEIQPYLCCVLSTADAALAEVVTLSVANTKSFETSTFSFLYPEWVNYPLYGSDDWALQMDRLAEQVVNTITDCIFHMQDKAIDIICETVSFSPRYFEQYFCLLYYCSDVSFCFIREICQLPYCVSPITFLKKSLVLMLHRPVYCFIVFASSFAVFSINLLWFIS
jgi:hypothetical protein